MKRIIIEADIFCPYCGERHIDQDKWRVMSHRKHLCESCGLRFSVTVRGQEAPEPPTPAIH